MQKFPGQGMNQCHRNNPRHNSDNTRSSTCLATRELPMYLFFSNSNEYLDLHTQASVPFSMVKVWLFFESEFAQTKRPVSLSWNFLLLLWTRGLRRSWVTGQHLPSCLDSELLLQGIFSSLLNLNALKHQELCWPIWPPILIQSEIKFTI